MIRAKFGVRLLVINVWRVYLQQTNTNLSYNHLTSPHLMMTVVLLKAACGNKTYMLETSSLLRPRTSDLQLISYHIFNNNFF